MAALNKEAAKGSDEAERVFRNTVLGETWIETGDAPDWQRLVERREDWPGGIVPAGGLFLTAGADVQKDRIEIDVWAWGRGLESWLVDHVVIEGGPARPESWEDVTKLLGRTWRHAGGADLGIARLAIDTGYETSAVYGWARSVGFAQVAPVKGLEGFNRASPVSGPTFADAHLARDVVDTADGGAPALIRAILRRPDDVANFGEARIWSETTRLDLRLAEVPSPRPGDRIEIDGEAFLIQGEPVRDRERLVWTVDLRPA